MATRMDAAPILVFWETTRACDLACRHCRAEAMPEPEPGELTPAEGLRLIDQLGGFEGRKPVLVLTGGDVMRRADLLELVARARSRGIAVALSPSVTPRLAEEPLAELYRLGVRSVSISLDGATAATHEGIRGVPGQFAETVAALELLRAMGFRTQVNTAVMRANAEELADVAALVAGLGATAWEVFFLVQVGRGRRLEELSPAENEDVAHFLYEASRYGFAVRTVEAPWFRRVVAGRGDRDPAGAGGAALADATRGPGPEVCLGPLYERLARRLVDRLGPAAHPARVPSARTQDGKGILFVGHDGSVFPAGFLPVSLGNVREGSPVELYRSSPLLQAIRRGEFAGRCGRCEWRDRCGGSRSRAWAASGNPLGEDPACAYLPAAPASERDTNGASVG